MAIKPWVGTVKAMKPDPLPRVEQSPPDCTLSLDFVHGYRSFDTRDNLRYNATGKIVYHAAALGIVYDPQTHTQQFMNEHSDDIVSFALHPVRIQWLVVVAAVIDSVVIAVLLQDGKTIATGEVGAKPKIVLWNSASTDRFIKSTLELT